MVAAWRVTLPVVMALMVAMTTSAQINIAPEDRCSPYNRSDYSYPQSIELRIIAENLNGKIISPYTGEEFSSRFETDIEHIVATSEAHDSGLCAAAISTRRGFARDLENLTLASPSVNRHQKSAKDLAEWMPSRSACWFAQTVVNVKAKYGLSMDSREAEVAIRTLNACAPREECQLTSQSETLNCYTGMSTVAPASDPQPAAGCFPQTTVYLTGRMNIRAGASKNGARIGVAQAGSYSVLRSAQGGSYCWLHIGRGWIAKTSLVSATEPVSNPPAQPVPQPAEGCFPQKTAYVTGRTNVRAEASINGARIGLAQPGSYSVSRSAQGGTYCWLHIDRGWIAKTAAVSATEPVSNPPAQPVRQPAVRQESQPAPQAQQQPAQPAQQAPAIQSALALYDNNGNGRITCAEARAHGIAPVRRGHPAYQYMDDRDNDGTVCE